MAGRFDVLITVDASLLHQQRLSDRPLAVVVLKAKTNRLPDLLPYAPALRALLERVRAGQGYELAD